jgi:hypothetical protein
MAMSSKGTHPARFGLTWFRGEDLNVIFYQNMPNLHNRYKSAERKISQKNPEYMLNWPKAIELLASVGVRPSVRRKLSHLNLLL